MYHNVLTLQVTQLQKSHEIIKVKIYHITLIVRECNNWHSGSTLFLMWYALIHHLSLYMKIVW